MCNVKFRNLPAPMRRAGAAKRLYLSLGGNLDRHIGLEIDARVGPGLVRRDGACLFERRRGSNREERVVLTLCDSSNR